MLKTLIMMLFISKGVMASDFVVSYDGFYDRLKVLSKGNFSSADIGFYLISQTGEPCDIVSGSIVTESQTYPLSYTNNSKLLLPFDKTLDKDKALIVVKPKAHQQCELKMQIESSTDYGKAISLTQMANLQSEFSDLIGRLSGFFLRNLLPFMMPEVVGVTLIFDHEVSAPDNTENLISCELNRCSIKQPDANDDVQLLFEQPIVKAIPLIIN
jgi:hypothetical protein